MLIEIPLIQKFMLFLGQPTYSVAVLLFSLLVGAGIGSWSSGFIWKSKTLLKLRIAVVIVSLLTGVYIFLLNPTFTIFLGDSFFIRILVSFALLFEADLKKVFQIKMLVRILVNLILWKLFLFLKLVCQLMLLSSLALSFL